MLKQKYGLLAPFLLSVLPIPLVNLYTVTGRGAWSTAGIELLYLPLLFGVLAVPLALIMLIFRRSRARGRREMAVALVVAVGTLCGILLGQQLRMYAFSLAAARAAPLVGAVEEYAADNGAPPEQLSRLVPRYLAELPEGLPPLVIVTGEEADKRFAGNPWALSALVPAAMLNWDEFIYLPLQNYPDLGAGSALERIGGWVYLHE